VTEGAVRKLLATKIERAGLRPFCREHGDLDPSHVQRVANGAKLSPAVLAALGLEIADTVTTYRRMKR
jgi:hypothetical protein